MTHRMKRGNICAFNDGHGSTCRSVESIQNCREAHDRKLQTDPWYSELRNARRRIRQYERNMAAFDRVVIAEKMTTDDTTKRIATPKPLSVGTVWTAPDASVEPGS